ncbi:MAG: DUF1223 domain-containing protein [Betaproteobacteria bacterium]
MPSRRIVNTLTAMLLPIGAMAATAAAAPTATGAACSASSGATIPAVVELYTSEGCDSCPPADRWFGALKDQAARGKVIPLAFHVDYWDYLGWKDRFGDPAFSARHRTAASNGGARVVYTPQVLFEGREFQQWRRTTPEKLSLSSTAKPARANLRIAAAPAGARKLQLDVSAKALQSVQHADAYVALFESGLSSDVKAGENKGVLLRHDFVVRRWLGPFAFKDGALSLAQPVELPGDSALAQSGIAVVAVDADGAVLQALSMPLRDCGS